MEESKMISFYTHAVNDYYVGLFRENFERHEARLAALKTREDAENYRREVREKIRRCFALPPRSGVPEGRECGVIRHDGFTIKKMIYEIRPGDFVSANVYLPEKSAGKAPEKSPRR